LATRRAQKVRLFDLYAQIAKALSNPGRLELLDFLAQAPHTVEELARKAQMSVANTSQHLQRLRQARLVDAEQAGTFRRYRLADPVVGQLWHTLRLVAHRQLAEVEQALDAYRDRRHEFERITAEELRARLRTGDAVLIDARPAEEYHAGHLPGALSIPVSEVERLLTHLPDDKQIVAYCRGPQCVLADEALATLAENGWHVARLEEGVIEWQLAGHEIEQPEV
jgi:DNA-binding transcriptional ArsR family regulator/rhodanese-related sulfurtransferase